MNTLSRFRPQATPLEDRTVPSAAAATVRSYDGSGNNLAHAAWGQAGSDFLRVAAAAYADGVSAPAGASRPSARAVSNAVSDSTGVDVVNDRLMSAFVYAWGQFIDHDLDLTPAGTADKFPVAVPKGDTSFDPAGTGTQTIALGRSAYDPATGTGRANPRQQVNANSAYLDGSMVYGSDAATAASLRTFAGGRLKTSAGDLLPTDAAGNYLAGDSRVNENPELTSLQTVFVREHNRLAARIAAADPKLTDEQVYQQARALVVGEIEAVTVNEWLPALLGRGLSPYQGYNPNTNAGVTNEFAAAGFRFGHSLLVDDIEFLGNDGTAVAPAMELKDAFFNPSVVAAHGIDPLLKYLASDPASEVDTKVVDAVRNFLFGAPGQGGFDLASLNIQRGRDHGLADYNTTRAAYGLPRVTSFAQVTPDAALQAKLKQLYGSVDNVDLWVGVLAEAHAPGGSVGSTDRAILLDQFTRLRDGDRFWYQRTMTGPALASIDSTRLSEVIARNTSLTTDPAERLLLQGERERHRVRRPEPRRPAAAERAGAARDHGQPARLGHRRSRRRDDDGRPRQLHVRRGRRRPHRQVRRRRSAARRRDRDDAGEPRRDRHQRRPVGRRGLRQRAGGRAGPRGGVRRAAEGRPPAGGVTGERGTPVPRVHCSPEAAPAVRVHSALLRTRGTGVPRSPAGRPLTSRSSRPASAGSRCPRPGREPHTRDSKYRRAGSVSDRRSWATTTVLAQDLRSLTLPARRSPRTRRSPSPSRPRR